jgi:hypothetical protein
METFIIILAISTLVSCTLLFIQWKNYKLLKKVVVFLRNVGDCNEEISSTSFLASLGIKNLNSFGYKLIPFFQSMFMLSTIEHSPIMISKIGQYVHRLKRLKDSPEKDYLIKTFKRSILESGVESLAFVIYQSIKIKHRDQSSEGKTVEEFMLIDIKNYLPYLRELELVIHKINFYEKSEPVLSSDVRKKIRENLDEVIKKLNKLTVK